MSNSYSTNIQLRYTYPFQYLVHWNTISINTATSDEIPTFGTFISTIAFYGILSSIPVVLQDSLVFFILFVTIFPTLTGISDYI